MSKRQNLTIQVEEMSLEDNSESMKLHEEICFTLTATLRPEILDLTLESFNKHLQDIDLKKFTIFMNLDPMPETMKDKTDEVINIVRKYFGTVNVNLPKEANFCKAIKWLWSQPLTPYIFHLEDDWEIFSSIKVSEMADLMKRNKNLNQVRVCKYINKSPRSPFYYGLSPCLVRKEFYRVVSKCLKENFNPEKQLRKAHEWGLKPHMTYKSSVSTVCNYPNTVVIRDIGREWRIKHGMSKEYKEINFVKWHWREEIIK